MIHWKKCYHQSIYMLLEEKPSSQNETRLETPTRHGRLACRSARRVRIRSSTAFGRTAASGSAQRRGSVGIPFSTFQWWPSSVSRRVPDSEKKCTSNWKRMYGHIKLESKIWSWSCSSCMRSVYVIQNTLANCVRVISGERRQFMCLFMCLSLPLYLYTGTCCTIKRCSNWKVPIRNCRRVVGPARSHRCIFFYVHRLLSHEKIVHSEMYTDFCFYIQTSDSCSFIVNLS